MAATYVQESFQLKYVFMYLSAQNKLYSKSTSVLSKDSTKADIIIKKPADSFFFFEFEFEFEFEHTHKHKHRPTDRK